ncbi:hypothetical protein FT663_02810 [Candidozyma haemuli var. vulneris]|nr:hypothetical protein FT663_02810 [[Candida] haemuloni var. vulneris]KAF3991995.1 hypothetical protein FT662_01448 [[Candida] haemuloni var. vulneris]
MLCPLCCSPLKKNLLSSAVAILVCSKETCVFPFNLSKQELMDKELVVRTDEAEIMQQMKTKLEDAGVEDQMVKFLSKADPAVQ